MSTPHKEKIIRVLQLFQTTDEKTPMNAVQISQKLEEEYGMENVHRTSIYDDVRLLQSCGYPIKQAENSHKGWYMEKHLLEDWEIKLMLDSVQQARCVSVHEANEIRNKLLNLTSQRGRSRLCRCPEMSGVSVRPLDNGKYKAVFKKMDSVTLVGWFVQYANRFKVISPKSLKDKIIESLEHAKSIYSE